MLSPRESATAAAVLLAVVARAAAAQSYPVEIEADRPGASIRIFDLDARGPEIACGERCNLDLRAGEYQLSVTDGGGRVGSRTLVIRRPSHVDVTPPSQRAHIAGVAMMAVGITAAVVGVGMLFYEFKNRLAISYSCGGDCDEKEHPWVWYAGAAGLAGGGSLALAGMMVDRFGGKVGLRVTRSRPRSDDGASLHLAPTVTERGLALGLSGRF
jgi:hypothetical protein